MVLRDAAESAEYVITTNQRASWPIKLLRVYVYHLPGPQQNRAKRDREMNAMEPILSHPPSKSRLARLRRAASPSVSRPKLLSSSAVRSSI